MPDNPCGAQHPKKPMVQCHLQHEHAYLQHMGHTGSKSASWSEPIAHEALRAELAAIKKRLAETSVMYDFVEAKVGRAWEVYLKFEHQDVEFAEALSEALGDGKPIPSGKCSPLLRDGVKR